MNICKADASNGKDLALRNFFFSPIRRDLRIQLNVKYETKEMMSETRRSTVLIADANLSKFPLSRW